MTNWQPDPGLLVLLAANAFDGIPMADQHMARHMSRHVRVLYVDPPLSPVSARRHPELAPGLRKPRLRREADGLFRLTPVCTPFPERSGVRHVSQARVRRLVREAVAQLGGPARAVVAARPMLPIVDVLPEAEHFVFWAQDDLVGGADLLGVSPRRIREGEMRLAEAADIIVAGTPGVQAQWRARGYDPVLIAYGTEAEHFAAVDRAPLPEDVKLPPPIAGFVGHIGDRIDVELLEAVASAGTSMLLVGPRHPRYEVARLTHLTRLANVLWVGHKSFEELPSYLRCIDVGLVPYADSAFNRGSFPLKTLEYLAAGRRVVSTDLPAVRWLSTDLIQVASSPGDYAAAVGSELVRVQRPGEADRRREFAAQHSWAERAKQLASVLGLAQAH